VHRRSPPPTHNVQAPKAALDVLLLESDAEFGACLRDLLRDAGHRVLLLENGLVGLAYLHAKLVDRLPLPDFIITSAGLPGFQGIDIVASLRRAGCTLPIAVIAGTPSEAMRARARSLDVSLLERPVPLDEICALVATHAAGP
jgi:DNA-binding response OmpR family regulator